MENANTTTSDAYRLGAAEATEQCSDGGGIYEIILNPTLENLRQYEQRVNPNGEHDNFDDLFVGVDSVPSDPQEAEDFRAGYMHSVWEAVTLRIAELASTNTSAAQ